MRGVKAHRILILEPARQRYRLRLLHPAAPAKDIRANYTLLGGESLCQYLLQENPKALIIARGPMPFLSGNKTTIGYISLLTGLPHYSFVGGRGFAQLLNLGLEAILFSGAGRPGEYIIVSGRAPRLRVEWKSAAELPSGQRSAFYWLLQRELDGHAEKGSIFTIGEGARFAYGGQKRLGYRTANLGADGIYHAGRGGAGGVLAHFAAALVLRGEPLSWQEWLGPRSRVFQGLREGEIRKRLEIYCDRLSRRDGGTIAKLHATGSGQHPTLPARNARQLGYALADLGGRKILQASRAGQTGCHWCQVNCRHWHWVPADYAPNGRDRFLDDFEPAYAILAMLDLQADNSSHQGKLHLLQEIDRRVILPIEQMGCDVIDIGLSLAALFEGLERGLIPLDDVPPCLAKGPYLGNLNLTAKAIKMLRQGDPSPALRAVGDGPQALAERYPALQEIVFTGGPGTLGNPGHANALWTFLMPFSRYFSHYSGQIYKIEGHLAPDTNPDEIEALFRRVIRQMLQREFFGCLGNALSTCAFTFIIYSQDGQGTKLDKDDLLVRALACYGIETTREELEWFAEAFWAQSIVFKLKHGWHSPVAADFPGRVFEALSTVMHRPAEELRALMDKLIAEWQRQAGEVMYKYGYEIPEW